MERVTLLGTDQLPVSTYNDYSECQSSLPHCFHLPADKCLYKNVAAVKGIFDSVYLGTGSVGSLASVLRYWREQFHKITMYETAKIQTIALILQES